MGVINQLITGGHHPAGADQTIAFPVKLCGLSELFQCAAWRFLWIPWTGALVKLGASHDHLSHQVTFFEVHNVTMYINVYQCISMYINVSKPHHIHICSLNWWDLMGRCMPRLLLNGWNQEIRPDRLLAESGCDKSPAPRSFAQVMRKIPGERLAEVLGRWYYAQQDPDTYRTGI